MKLVKLYLTAFGPFTERVLDFGSTGQSMVLVYGPNEAGKSAMLRAISDLRSPLWYSAAQQGQLYPRPRGHASRWALPR